MANYAVYVYAALSVILVIALYTQSGAAISCFVCNSHKNYDGQDCIDVTPNNTKSPFYKNCSNEPLPHHGRPYERCRIQVQDVDDDSRIIRSCATASQHEHKGGDCFDRTGTSKIKLRFCECDRDGCNSGTTIYASVLTLAVSLLIGWKLFWDLSLYSRQCSGFS